MKTLLIVGAMLVLCTGISRAQGLTGPVYNHNNGHIYYLLAPTNWTAAEAEAVSLGGHLATIRNASENDWVWSTFTALNGDNNFFIGLTDQGQEGNFFWISGETTPFRNWRVNEPNNTGGEDFALIRAIDGEWNDVSGLLQYGVVEVIPVPEPSALALLGMGGLIALARFPFRAAASSHCGSALIR